MIHKKQENKGRDIPLFHRQYNKNRPAIYKKNPYKKSTLSNIQKDQVVFVMKTRHGGGYSRPPLPVGMHILHMIYLPMLFPHGACVLFLLCKYEYNIDY